MSFTTGRKGVAALEVLQMVLSLPIARLAILQTIARSTLGFLQGSPKPQTLVKMSGSFAAGVQSVGPSCAKLRWEIVQNIGFFGGASIQGLGLLNQSIPAPLPAVPPNIRSRLFLFSTPQNDRLI